MIDENIFRTRLVVFNFPGHLRELVIAVKINNNLAAAVGALNFRFGAEEGAESGFAGRVSRIILDARFLSAA
jgi:hypothetical protein